MSTSQQLNLFREIMIVPFAIRCPDQDDANGKDLRKALAKQLDLAGDKWARVEHSLFHLNEDIEADACSDPAQRRRNLTGAYQEFVYFEPFVQDFLYQRFSDQAPIQIYRSSQTKGKISVAFDPEERGADNASKEPKEPTLRCELDVLRLEVLMPATGNAFLILEAELADCYENDKWRQGELSDALRLLESLRRTFPPFFQKAGNDARLTTRFYPKWEKIVLGDTVIWQSAHKDELTDVMDHVIGLKEGKKADPKYPLFEPWRALLAPLCVAGYDDDSRKAVLEPLGDDRAFVVATVGVRNPRAISEGDWHRLSHLDWPDKGSPYAREFSRQFPDTHYYDRFFDQDNVSDYDTRYLVSDYALVAVGRSDGNPDDGFFHPVIAEHMRRNYFKIALIAFLQKTALKTLADKTASILYNRDGTDEAKFYGSVSALQREVYAFTHRYWFESISNQLQAREIFDMLRKHLRTRELHRQLDQEITEAGNAASLEQRHRQADEAANQAKEAQRLSTIAGVGLAASVIVGFLGMNLFEPADDAMKIGPVSGLGFILSLSAITLLLYLCRDGLINWFHSKSSQRKLPIVIYVMAILALLLYAGAR